MFFFTQKKDCNFTIHYFSGSDRFDIRSGSTDPGCRFSYLFSNADSSRFYYKPHYSTGVTISTGQADAIRLLFFTGDYTIDPSAQGLVGDIPQTITPKRLVAPHFSIFHNALNVTIAHKAEMDPSAADMQTAIDEVVAAESANNPLPAHREIRKGYYIELRILQDDAENDSSYEHIKHIKPAEIYTHKLPALGTYNLTATYVIAECDKNTNPQDMSTCLVRRLTYSKNYEFSPRHAKIVVDGNSGAYDTDKMQCTNDGTDCLPPPLYENCSVYDIKIHFWSGGPEFSMPSISSIWCSLKNFAIFIDHGVFRPLFIPNSYRVSLLFERVLGALESSFGFLWTPVFLVKSVYQGILDNQISGDTCALPPLTIFGSTATVHLCQWRYQLPGLWRYMQIAIQAGLLVGFIWALYRSLMSFFGARVDDYDESGDEYEEVRWHDDRTGQSGDWERRRK